MSKPSPLYTAGRVGEVVQVAGRRNERLRAAREQTPSGRAPGECMSRSELAEAVNAWLWRCTGRRYELDGHHIAKYERAAVRYPIAPYRAGLRAVLDAATDTELGFVPPPARRSPISPGSRVRVWSPGRRRASWTARTR